MKNIDLEKLKDVKFTFGKRAFAPKVMYCSRCDTKMKKALIDMNLSEDIVVKLNIFRCPKDDEEMLGFDEARKLDRALVINRLLSKTLFGFKRKLSYDGDNYILRLPGEFTQGKKHTEVTIVPLEYDEALIKW